MVEPTISEATAESLIQGLRRERHPPAQSTFPKFRATAVDYIEDARAEALSSVRMRLTRIFTPSQPIADRHSFAGRKTILEILIRAIEDLRLHVVLYGNRGLGKTSLLHVLAQAAREARYLVCYVPCGASSNFDDVMRTIAASVPLLYFRGVDPTAPEAEKGATLERLLPSNPLTPALASDLFSRITDTRVIVILDELDRCESREFRLNVAELMKNISDRSVRVQFVIAGVAANLTELLEYIPSIQRNIFTIELPKMRDNEIREMITQGEANIGLRFEELAIQGIITAAGGFPYLASLLSHYAGLHAIDDARTTVQREDVLYAVRAALANFEIRVSKKSLADISRCVQNGHLHALGPIAGAAQILGERFDFDEISKIVSTSEMIIRCERLVRILANDQILIEEVPAVEKTFRFIDQNVIPYIWLLHADSKLRDSVILHPIATQSVRTGAVPKSDAAASK